jgi:endonuclease/exonuclease/phosphatase family metal-dependent hydrolase
LRFLPPASRVARVVWRIALIEALLGPLLGCDPFHVQFDDVEPAVAYRASTTTAPADPDGELVVMTWNVKFAGGRIDFFVDCHGDRVLMTEGEVITHLRGLADYIAEVEPDVLLLQEVDVDSKRVAYVDTLQWLLDHTDLNYGVYASQWRADYVPSDGLGPVDSGNAILSRWPLTDAERVALPLIEEQDALTRYFWLRRNLLRARLDLPRRDDVWVVNTHTAAFSTDGTKKKQIDRFKEELDRLGETGVVIGGGDLNALPPMTEKLEGFPDSACEGEFEADSYAAEVGWLDDLFADYEEAIPLDEYAEDNTPYFTHTTDGDGFWNRRLDYLFTNSSFHDGLVHQSGTMPLSDHAPVTATVKLP